MKMKHVLVLWLFSFSMVLSTTPSQSDPIAEHTGLKYPPKTLRFDLFSYDTNFGGSGDLGNVRTTDQYQQRIKLEAKFFKWTPQVYRWARTFPSCQFLTPKNYRHAEPGPDGTYLKAMQWSVNKGKSLYTRESVNNIMHHDKWLILDLYRFHDSNRALQVAQDCCLLSPVECGLSLKSKSPGDLNSSIQKSLNISEDSSGKMIAGTPVVFTASFDFAFATKAGVLRGEPVESYVSLPFESVPDEANPGKMKLINIAEKRVGLLDRIKDSHIVWSDAVLNTPLDANGYPSVEGTANLVELAHKHHHLHHELHELARDLDESQLLTLSIHDHNIDWKRPRNDVDGTPGIVTMLGRIEKLHTAWVEAVRSRDRRTAWRTGVGHASRHAALSTYDANLFSYDIFPNYDPAPAYYSDCMNRYVGSCPFVYNQ